MSLLQGPDIRVAERPCCSLLGLQQRPAADRCLGRGVRMGQARSDTFPGFSLAFSGFMLLDSSGLWVFSFCLIGLAEVSFQRQPEVMCCCRRSYLWEKDEMTPSRCLITVHVFAFSGYLCVESFGGLVVVDCKSSYLVSISCPCLPAVSVVIALDVVQRYSQIYSLCS